MTTPETPTPFLVFEGPEGAGKSTQIEHLAARLRERGHDVLVTREPGGTPPGDRIRSVLLDPELDMAPETEFLLYAAARAEHVRSLIAPALNAGRIVLCDRFAASSVAYQGYGRGLDPTWVRDVNTHATQGLHPTATLLLDLPAAEGLARVAARGATDRLERADLAFHERVRDGFLRQAAEDARWTALDARQPEDTVREDVWQAVRPLFPTPVPPS